MAKAIMIQGTASNAGKSILTAGLCRVFLEDGVSVAPFKAQNMALNSGVTPAGLEMGRAQVTQAAACRIEADVHMNPVLLKPSAGMGSQVIVMGKPAGHMNLETYAGLKQRLRTVIHDAYHYLDKQYDLLVIEGAGSPAEINLKKNDITNMHVAKMANCPVVIVGDIDRGGVYAHLIGTYDLLDKDEQELTAGFIINKFRGDASQLAPANTFLENRTGKKLFGVVPMINDLALPDEDSVQFKEKIGKGNTSDNNSKNNSEKIHIALVDLPHISNFTDFDVLARDPDVVLTTVVSPRDLGDKDIIILPGSKNTLWDMNYLRQKGFVPELDRCAAGGKMIIGICGGYQMLGKTIADPGTVETAGSQGGGVPGLGYLDMDTVMAEEKRLTRVSATCTTGDAGESIMENIVVTGYEIHHGRSRGRDIPFLVSGNGEIIGTRNPTGNTWGTYIHGVFDRGAFRNYIINRVRVKKGLPPTPQRDDHDIDAELTRLAAVIRRSLDIKALYAAMGF